MRMCMLVCGRFRGPISLYGMCRTVGSSGHPFAFASPPLDVYLLPFPHHPTRLSKPFPYLQTYSTAHLLTHITVVVSSNEQALR